MHPETPAIVATTAIVLIALAPAIGLAVKVWLMRRREKSFEATLLPKPPRALGNVPASKTAGKLKVTFTNGSIVYLRRKAPKSRQTKKKR